MNAETGTEPEAPKKRGRIPQSAWPQILERYRSGATLSAIAREFECTPSAISYIIRKAEAANGTDAGGTDKDEAAEAPTETAAEAPAAEAPAIESPASEAVPVQATVAEAPAPATPAASAPAAEPKPEPKPERRAASSAGASAPTETLRLNRPAEPQPAPQPAPAPVAAPQPTTAQPAAAAADAGRPGANPPPVDAVEARLRDTARGCLTAYRGWRQQPGEASIQALSEAVHELRKALARIEIDMSASRREEQALRPIPIPAHRTARRTP
ncbi:hypothetical protein [Azospirillum sp. sgz302134]